MNGIVLLDDITTALLNTSSFAPIRSLINSSFLGIVDNVKSSSPDKISIFAGSSILVIVKGVIFLPSDTVKSKVTTQSLLFLLCCILSFFNSLIVLPNRHQYKASAIVLLPIPFLPPLSLFSPVIMVTPLIKSILIGLLPIERKF